MSVRHISPMGMRVVVRIRKERDQTEAGLYLPEGSKESMQESLLCEVLEVARAHDADTEREENISGVPEGALVLIPKHAGTRIPWDDQLRLVETKDILALINEVELN